MSTVVFCHAHPDDEVLLTGGTMAALARAGHRVVLVTATVGEAGLARPAPGAGSLGRIRRVELETSAEILGCAELTILGFRDSGMTGPLPADSFAATPVDQAAARLAAVLEREHADVVTGYDSSGGYGHRDHVHLHRVVRAAARLAGTRSILEATIDRQAYARAVRTLRRLGIARELLPVDTGSLFAAPAEITHRIRVGRLAHVKRAAIEAHVSQTRGGDTLRTLELLLRLPPPLFRAVMGREWYVQVGVAPGGRRHSRFPVAR